jgi:hypothetical protein
LGFEAAGFAKFNMEKYAKDLLCVLIVAIF